uniref:Uncharacterized protein n=1 Tax=Glossina palpalis gambiensis TaxID=67801 RepID=A0A1B0B9T5_9MUSC
MGITYEQIKANGNSIVVERQENLKVRKKLKETIYQQIAHVKQRRVQTKQAQRKKLKSCEHLGLKEEKSQQICDSADKACQQLCCVRHPINNEIGKLKQQCRVLGMGITSGLSLSKRKNTSVQQNADSSVKWNYSTKTLDEIRAEKFSNKHKFTCSSPRCRDEEIAASRPRGRTVGSQINSSKSVEADRGALGDHKSLNKLTEKGYKDSNCSYELDEKAATDMKRDWQEKRYSDIKVFLTSPENMDLKGKNDQIINIFSPAVSGNGLHNNFVSTPNNYRSKYCDASSGYDNNGVFNQSCYQKNRFSSNGYGYNCTHNEGYRNHPLMSTQRDATTNTFVQYTPRDNCCRTSRRRCPPSFERQGRDLDTDNFCYRTGSSPNRPRRSSPSSKRASNPCNKKENGLCTKYESAVKSKLQKDLREQFQKARERARAKVREKHQIKDISEANCEKHAFFKKKERGEYCKDQERERDKMERKFCDESAEAFNQKLPQASCSNLSELLNGCAEKGVKWGIRAKQVCINEKSAKREEPTSSSSCTKVRRRRRICEITFTKQKPKTRRTCSPCCLCPEYFTDETQCYKIPLPCEKRPESEYSFETLCMLTKKKVTEYKPSKTKNNEKDKQYNDYINKYKKEQEKASLREQPSLTLKRKALESTPKHSLSETARYQSPVKSPPQSGRTSTRRSRNDESPIPIPAPFPAATPFVPTPLIRTSTPAPALVPTPISDPTPFPTPIPHPIPTPNHFLTSMSTPIRHSAYGEPSQQMKKLATPPVTSSSPSLVIPTIAFPKQQENLVAPETSYQSTNSIDKDIEAKVDQFTERTTAVEGLNTTKIKPKECIRIKECIAEDGTQITQIQRHLSVEEIFNPNIDRYNMESTNSNRTLSTSPSVPDPLVRLKNLLVAFQKQCVDVEGLQRLGATVVEALSKIDLWRGGDKVKIMKTIETQCVESEIYEMNTLNYICTTRSTAPADITMHSRENIEDFPERSRDGIENREINTQTLSAADSRKKQLPHFPPPPPITCSTCEDEHYRLPSCHTSLAYYGPTSKTSPASQRHTIDCSTYSRRCRSKVSDTSASLSPENRNIMNSNIGNQGNVGLSFNSNYQKFQEKNPFLLRNQSICRRSDCSCTHSQGSLGLQSISPSKYSDSFGTLYGSSSCSCACEKSHVKYDSKSSNSIYKDCTSNICTHMLQQSPASPDHNNCLVIDRQIPVTTCSMPQFSNLNNDDFANKSCNCAPNMLQCQCSAPSNDASCPHSASEKPFSEATPLRGILECPTSEDCKSRVKSCEDCLLRDSNYFEAEQCTTVTNEGPQKKVQAGISYKDACVKDRQKILEQGDGNVESILYKDQDGRPINRVFRTTMSESAVRKPLNFCKGADLHASKATLQSVSSQCSATKKSPRKSSTCLCSKNLHPCSNTRLDDHVPPFTHCPCMYDAYISMLEVYRKDKGNPVNLYRQC